jgi:uncharacterized protein YbjT (DUF2867 family)
MMWFITVPVIEVLLDSLSSTCCVLQVVAADLDQPDSLLPYLSQVKGVYCHALSGDAATADPQELARGRALAHLASGCKDLQLLVYNSSAGRGSNAGISQVRVRVACPCWPTA